MGEESERAVTLAMALVCDLAFGGTTAAVVTAAVALAFAWFAFPLRRLIGGERSH